MMKVLFIFNYQREVPPFMQTAIFFAKNYFDKVIYVTRCLTNDNTETIRFPNVEVVQVSDSLRQLMFALSPIRGFANKYIRSELMKNHNLSLFKAQMTTQFMSDCLYFTACDHIQKYVDQGYEICTLATWFSSEAVTIARLKRRFKIRKTVSFAHSFEIDPDKNRFVSHSFNAFKHQNIDEVHYISHKMKGIYYDTAKQLNIDKLFDDKAYFTYLGSIKYFKNICNPSSDGIYRIVSCSGATPVKRLHLIIEALKCWNNGGRIEWTHIGGGPLLDEINILSEELMRNNPRVSVRLLGWKNNKEVQQYYSESPVDIFINVSEAEGLPVSIMEAMSYGIPCLATNVGGTSEIVNDSTGFLLQKNCSGLDVFHQLDFFYKLNISEKMKYREDAYKIWKEKFDAENTMSNFFSNLSE